MKFIFRFLRNICPAHLYEEIEGDLIQKFKRDVKNFGEKRARRRLLWNVIRFCRPGIILRNKPSFYINPSPMFKNYLITSIRHIKGSKLNFGFKLGGLTLAIFSFLFFFDIFLIVLFLVSLCIFFFHFNIFIF